MVSGMRFFHFLALALVLISPSLLHAQRERLPSKDLAIVNKRWPEAERTATGLRTVVLQEGKGELAKPGDMVSVLYIGQLLDGTTFDQAMNPEKPLRFRLGRGNVILGWDQGLQLMRPGEKRILIIPFELAYGTRGHPPAIPPKSTLVFQVELLAAQK